MSVEETKTKELALPRKRKTTPTKPIVVPVNLLAVIFSFKKKSRQAYYKKRLSVCQHRSYT